MFSVLIMTKNEELDLPGCLDSVTFCDDIHVFDSFSDDETSNIAAARGVHIHQRVFDGYASQRNAALTTINFKYDWVFFIDADERIPAALQQELNEKILKASKEVGGFSIRRKDYLNNVWLKHAQITPFYVRCFRPERVSYHREINEVITVQGETKILKEYFSHYPFSKGFKHWIKKHNQYSSMEAARWVQEHQSNMAFSLKEAIFGKDITVRRYNQKGLFYKLPGRPLIKWLYIVFGRRAFLDGKPGFTYATLQSIYEYFIVLKTKELLSKGAHNVDYAKYKKNGV